MIPQASLGEIASEVSRPVALEPDVLYRSVGVKWYGAGVHVHETREGHLFDADRFRIEQDDLIYNDMWARMGSVAIVPPDLAGSVASSHFPTFRLDETKVIPSYLAWYFRTPSFWNDCENASRGSTGRNQIKRSTFSAIHVPLPPLDEQRRIVARIEELAAKVEEACTLRTHSRDAAEQLVGSFLKLAFVGALTAAWRSEHKGIESTSQLIDRISRIAWSGHRKARHRSPIALPAPPEVPQTWSVAEVGVLQESGLILDIQDGNHGNEYPRKAEFVSEGIPFVTAKQIFPEGVDISGAPRLSHEKASRLRIGFAKGGDVLLTHNASVGDVALAPDDAGDFIVGTSVTYWRLNPVGLNPRYVYYFLKSVHFQDQLAFIMKQTTRNQVSVLKQVNLWMCVPPIDEQAEIVRRIGALEHSLQTLAGLQFDTATELDAMLPAILDKAFKGEL
jgi:type I restriction enzyme S subunit